MLYTGYVLLSIPFAFAIGGADHPQARRELDPLDPPLRARPPGLFLGLGLLLGSRWSYEELGWGGYWGWDPVENAALMPFLVDHRLPALDHGPGAPRDAQGLEREPDLRRLRAGAARHLPGALGDPAVDPRLRRLDRRRAAAGPDRRRRDRLDRADRQPAARTSRPERRIELAALARGDLPGQQPAPGRPRGRHLLGHLLPADRRGVHRHPLVARRRPGSTAT